MTTVRLFRLAVLFLVALGATSIASYAQPDGEGANHPDTLLLDACLNGYTDQITDLLEKGANPDARREGDNWTPLMLAAMNGYTEIVQILLEHDANPQLGTDDEGTPLCVAASSFILPEEDPDAIVNLLLDHGANLYGRNGSGMIPLMYAAREGKTSTVVRLLNAGTDVNYQDVRMWSALLLAVHNDQNETADILIAAGADPDVKGEVSQWTPLNLAVQNANNGMARILLEAGADPNGLPPGNDFFTPPIWFAAMNENVEVARMLLEKGASPNFSDGGYWSEDEKPRTALDWAIEKKNRELEKMLRDAGGMTAVDLEKIYVAAVRAVRDGDMKGLKKLTDKKIDPRRMVMVTVDPEEDYTSLLNEAAKRGDAEMVRTILSYPLLPSPYDLYAAYMIAVENEQTECAEQIIRSAPGPIAIQAVDNWQTDLVEKILGIAPEVVHYAGWEEQTPLHMAVQIGDMQIASMLLEAGADPNSIDRWGESAMFGAARLGLTEIAELLLEWGGDVEHRSKNGMTPLHAAVLADQSDMITWLLEHDANLYSTDYQGWNALHFAAWSGSPSITRMIMDLGIEPEWKTDQGETPLDLARRFDAPAVEEELTRTE